ncbi:alpha-protein kinase 1 isoform X1 [Triplophysa dalaica]|uniref:alpha-protein kinase 1 isoform X1 n=1 Tax=Triplophysa dalaica TaxID=1582913 RepID=UPI0024DF3136|nr:alpha-protein kinase 1 isoform X1 [Triplophysa dalaica]
MSEQQVTPLLHECLRCAIGGPTEAAHELAHPSGFFPDDLSALLQEAVDRKWPFVEEKWQYKQSVTSEDKINSSDLIRRHLPRLLIFLRDSIVADEPEWAVAVVFLVDRLLYWMDSSHILLKIAKALHKRYPAIPIAPQIIIRQARVYLNSGKLQKAEVILSRLINRNASTGSWTYVRVSEQTLVQAVSLQVRGQVLHKLGLWIDAFELIWASLVGFYALPEPDRKGIGTSLGLLAQILISMNDQDFDTLRKKTHIDFSLLGEHHHHRLLSAARAAQMAVVYSQYGSLYVLTNVVAQGTCLLSYSFSDKRSIEDQNRYLTLANEAFEIGLLTNTSDTVTSKLELHTLLKASYCLTLTHRWMKGQSESITKAMRMCHEALTLFFEYSSSADFSLSTDITAQIQRIKSLLNVKSFSNSDPHSFVPDGYRSVKFGPVRFALHDFATLIDSFGKHHRSVCETFEMSALMKREDPASTCCITAFQIDTERSENPEHQRETLDGCQERTSPNQYGNDGFMEQSLRRKSSDMFSSRQDSSGSGSSFVLVNSNCGTEISDDERSNSVGPSKPNVDQQKTRNTKGFQRGRNLCTTEDETGPGSVTNNRNDIGKSLRVRASGSSGSSLDSSYEHIPVQPQSSIETVEDILDLPQFDCDVTSLSVTNQDAKVKTKDGSVSSYSLADSFGSRSSWEKLSVSPVTNTSELPQTNHSRQRSSQNVLKVRERVRATMLSALSSTETDPFEELGFEHLSVPDHHQEKHRRFGTISESCNLCFEDCMMGSDILTERDYRCLFAGVCHGCLLRRLPNKPLKSLDSRRHSRAYDAVILKYSKASDVWTALESSVFIGERTGDCGTQRRALEVLYLHQEQLLSRYVGKEYLKEKGLHAHLHDVERQMSAQHYVTEFNKRLYDSNITAQIFFIPSEVLLILERGRIETCLSAEPYMSGDFSKLTNNTKRTKTEHAATKYAIAFGHFTYEFSNHEEVVVDLQGWITSNGKGLTYLTDPQIHSLRKPRLSNFQQTGIDNFLKYQHGDECNEICRAAGLNTIHTIKSRV